MHRDSGQLQAGTLTEHRAAPALGGGSGAARDASSPGRQKSNGAENAYRSHMRFIWNSYAPFPPQRTFSVASPISARIRLMIQNRITICGSAQPFFSKW